jgi:4-hydroxybenzoate polyprenyltransferase
MEYNPTLRSIPWSRSVFAAVSRSLAPIRAGTWWEYKTPVALGVAYAAALAGGVPFSRLWPAILAVVAALVPLASYVCVINDITDERDDVRAGKSNRLAGKPAAFKRAWLLACLVGCCLAGVFCFRGHPVAAGLYAANWLAFTLYSVPPIRLKSRGLAGVLADASGGTLLPALWSALLADPAASPAFLAAVAAWAGAFGLRGILYHQAGDLECDRDAGVGTLAVRLGPQRVALLVALLLFPVEMVALGAIVWMAQMRYAIPLLLVYAALQGGMWRFFQVHTVLVLPRERHRFAMLKYYQFWFPIAGLLELAAADSRAFAVIAAHLVLFPETWWRFPAHVADAGISRRLGRLWRRLW